MLANEQRAERGCEIVIVCLRKMLPAVILVLASLPGFAQAPPNVIEFFRQSVGLTEDQIADIKSGKPVVKAMPSRTPDEIVLFGAIYIHATPESYLKFHQDFNRLRKLPGVLALGVISNPPQLADFEGFGFDSEEIESLKDCRPGDCAVQLPAGSIQEFQRSVDFSASDAQERVNEKLRSAALDRLLAYQHEGLKALGAYNDKQHPVDVQRQFAFALSYTKVLPARLPELYNYLLSYPNEKPENVEDQFYWERVKFGLKPTLRVVQLTTMQAKPGDDVACTVAEKQLYSSHYFHTALDLSFCVLPQEDANSAGFYLIKALGSEQSGLGGFKGGIIRKNAVGKSLSNLKNSLTAIRATLESRK